MTRYRPRPRRWRLERHTTYDLSTVYVWSRGDAHAASVDVRRKSRAGARYIIRELQKEKRPA